MHLIAFDLGKHLAYTHNIIGVAMSGVEVFEGNRTQRACDTMAMLRNLFAEHPTLEAVIYETPFCRGRAATRALWGLAGIIEATATEAGLPCVDIPPSKLKKWATGGNGKASKDEMIEAAQGMGYIGTDEHEADSYCLLAYGLKYIEEVKPDEPRPRRSTAPALPGARKGNGRRSG